MGLAASRSVNSSPASMPAAPGASGRLRSVRPIAPGERGKRPVAVLKIAPFWRSAKRRVPAMVATLDDAVGLDAFGSESGSSVPTSPAPFPVARTAPKPPKRGGGRGQRVAISVAAVLLVALGVGAVELRGHSLPWIHRTGLVTFDTVPSGVDVFVGQNKLGRSPFTIALAPGNYDVRLGSGPQARTLAVTVTAGASVVQHYEMAASTAAVPKTGGLRIQTEPANLTVLVDAVEKGTSPVTLDAIDPGDHEIAVRRDQNVTTRVVHVTAGEKTSVIVAAEQPKAETGAVTAGWLSANAPIPLKVKEAGRVIGSTEVDKLMLSSGNHDLEFVDDELGFHATKRVNVLAGKTTAITIAVPNGSVSLNAVPWADVFVDGSHIGQTPLGNVQLPIGTHEVVFRHPDLGERKETVTVTALTPARLGVDLRKK